MSDTTTVARSLFHGGGDFMRELQREVEARLSPAMRRRGRARLYLKAFIAIGSTLAAWATLIFVRPGLLLGIVCLAVLAAGAVLTGFCVQHDANHGAAFSSRRYNHLLGFSADALLGVSSYAWRVRHNVAHHTYTNVVGYDDDVDQTPFARLAPTQRRRPWYRLQHIYIWPLYCFMGVRMQLLTDPVNILRGSTGQSKMRFPRGWDLAGLVGGKLLFAVWAIALPMLVYPWTTVLIAYLAVLAIVGLVMSTVFQLAHSVEDADRDSAEGMLARKSAWAKHQVETTVDFCPRNRVLTWWLGGLNYQIEHHLFPRIPHTLYPQIAGIVRAAAERHGIRYTCTPTLRGALGSHVRHLREMGRLGLPAEIEMG